MEKFLDLVFASAGNFPEHLNAVLTAMTDSGRFLLEGHLFDSANSLLNGASVFLDGGGLFSDGGGGTAITLMAGAGLAFVNGPADGTMAAIRRWHGTIDDQFSAIDNLVTIIVAHKEDWEIPPYLLTQLTESRNQLQLLINRCRSQQGSGADREQRNALLKHTVGLCLLQTRIWAYGEYTAGTMTAEDVHLLGFLLPGEAGGRRSRTEATNIVPEVKVRVVNEDFIRVVIDQSAGVNAAEVEHGWPPGAKMALIVITASDGQTEVYRQFTTRLHNDIKMPKGSGGKQFVAKAAFLKHVNDEPRFGPEPTFSMPVTTEDLLRIKELQHLEDVKEHEAEVERHRQEVEQLQKDLDGAKNAEQEPDTKK